jgi:hypothetical protein
MMTQEEFMDVNGMRAAGMTLSEIADATGYHRTTIAKWIKPGGPPERRAPAAERIAASCWSVPTNGGHCRGGGRLSACSAATDRRRQHALLAHRAGSRRRAVSRSPQR